MDIMSIDPNNLFIQTFGITILVYEYKYTKFAKVVERIFVPICKNSSEFQKENNDLDKEIEKRIEKRVFVEDMNSLYPIFLYSDKKGEELLTIIHQD